MFLGRLDVNTTVMTLASFKDEPRQCHLDRCKIVVPCLAKFEWSTIRISNEEPDLSSATTALCDREESVYVKGKELTPYYEPVPLGNHVLTVSYHDANVHHNVIIWRSVTGVLHMSKKTSADWHSKNQSAVETVICYSECSSARAFVEKILDLCITLRLLGVSLLKLSYMFEDNDSAVNSSMTTHGKCIKSMWPYLFIVLGKI